MPYPRDRREPQPPRRAHDQPQRRGARWLQPALCALLAAALLGGCAQQLRWPGVAATVATVAESGGASSARPSAAALPQGAPAEIAPVYRIGPGDELVITVWGRPDLGSQVPAPDGSRRNLTLVRADGSVGLPLIGAVTVAGKTAAEAAAALADAYRAIVPEPMVEVAVAAARAGHVTLSGAVRRPGNVFLGPAVATLSDAISAAGGLSEAADSAAGVLVRCFCRTYARSSTLPGRRGGRRSGWRARDSRDRPQPTGGPRALTGFRFD